jgi:hypothetical protein
VNKCALPILPGTRTCKGLIPLYGFNATKGACEKFYYFGCDGNGNQFDTQDACERECVKLKALSTGAFDNILRPEHDAAIPQTPTTTLPSTVAGVTGFKRNPFDNGGVCPPPTKDAFDVCTTPSTCTNDTNCSAPTGKCCYDGCAKRCTQADMPVDTKIPSGMFFNG